MAQSSQFLGLASNAKSRRARYPVCQTRRVPLATTEEQIKKAEAVIGRRLPTLLRQSLLQANGGEVKVVVEGREEWWGLFPVRDDRDMRHLKRTTSDLVLETEKARQWRTFPVDAIAVGCDGGGDLLVLQRHSEQLERWDHETGHVFPIETIFPVNPDRDA